MLSDGITGSKKKTIDVRSDASGIEALDNYAGLHDYQEGLVRKGLDDMRIGRVISHEVVVERLKRTGRASR